MKRISKVVFAGKRVSARIALCNRNQMVSLKKIWSVLRTAPVPVPHVVEVLFAIIKSIFMIYPQWAFNTLMIRSTGRVLFNNRWSKIHWVDDNKNLGVVPMKKLPVSNAGKIEADAVFTQELQFGLGKLIPAMVLIPVNSNLLSDMSRLSKKGTTIPLAFPGSQLKLMCPMDVLLGSMIIHEVEHYVHFMEIVKEHGNDLIKRSKEYANQMNNPLVGYADQLGEIRAYGKQIDYIFDSIGSSVPSEFTALATGLGISSSAVIAEKVISVGEMVPVIVPEFDLPQGVGAQK